MGSSRTFSRAPRCALLFRARPSDSRRCPSLVHPIHPTTMSDDDVDVDDVAVPETCCGRTGLWFKVKGIDLRDKLKDLTMDIIHMIPKPYEHKGSKHLFCGNTIINWGLLCGALLSLWTVLAIYWGILFVIYLAIKGWL